METVYGMGWKRDLPDNRDYDSAHKDIKPILAKVFPGLGELKQEQLPSRSSIADTLFSPVEDQGRLGSCTANAGCGLIEFYERKSSNSFVDASRLFLYKVTRELLGLQGDTGADLRSTMKAMVLFGVPPEKFRPYFIADFDSEPSAFLYAFAQNYRSLRYFRIDTPDLDPAGVLAQLKRHIAAGIPSMFGFRVFDFGNEKGEFTFPSKGQAPIGGHAVIAMGYDDDRQLAGGRTGALRIRNSWGAAWGEQGYGWLPYDFVRAGLAVDFWSLVKADQPGI